ncbi:MAG: hypothetical protein GWN58_35145, partial [Anaerolineae bacterium]|nr:hypothetical protein [Anaerolineae bacterium]
MNIDKVADEYIAMIEASERWNAIADAVAAKVSAAGYGVSREAIQALAMGDKMKAVELLEEEEAMKATVEAYGETAATALSEPFKEGLTTPTYVQDMLDALNAQFDEQEAEWDALGLKMGGAVSAGFLKAMMS